MLRLAWLLLPVAGLLACKRADAPAAAPPPPPPLDAGALADGDEAQPSAPAAPVAPPLEPTAMTAEAQKLLANWLAAQNGGDPGAYAALYDMRSFRGVKRTIGGKAQVFDGAGWLRDRRRMFRQRFEVAAEDVTITTWLDPDSPLPDGVASLRFVQRWKGGGYADHGTKVLQAWRDPAGRWRIVYEDLLNSEPGWDRAPAHVTPLALSPPADDAAARALWRVVAPTGADYHDKLAAIPLDPAVARPMARALLVEGNLRCTMVVPSASCGETLDELAPVRPDADIDDPCLRRRLAKWALERLTPADVRAVAPALVAMAGLPMPEIDLPELVLRTVPRSDVGLRLQVLAAAVEAEHATIADDYVDGLTGAALVEAAGYGLDSAVAALSAREHRAALVAAIDDDRLAAATRRDAIKRLAGDRGADVTAALVAIADDDDCELAMTAAATLADRGDRSYLPRRPDADGPAALIRALCLSAHDPDKARATRLFSALVARDATLTTEQYAEAEDNDEGNGQSSEESHLTVADIAVFDGPLGDCSVDGECPVGESGTTARFSTSRQGKPVVAGVTRRIHIQCGCELIEFGAR